MNLHHLELFYYVAKHEGITAAAKKMPYGIQQPAISAQLAKLEEEVGVKLFHRRPFALTPEGEALYDQLYPFFSRLREMGEALRGEGQNHLRVAATATILRSHLPAVLVRLRQEVPDLRLTLREADPGELDGLLLRQEVDVAIALEQGVVERGLIFEELLRLTVVMTEPAKGRKRTWEDLVETKDGMRRLKDPVIHLPSREPLMASLSEVLEKRNIIWNAAVAVSSMDSMESYVREGFGIGVGVMVPGRKPAVGLRMIPVPDAKPLRVGLLRVGPLKPLAARFAELVRKQAKSLANA